VVACGVVCVQGWSEGLFWLEKAWGIEQADRLVLGVQMVLTISAPLSPSCRVGPLRRTRYAAYDPPCLRTEQGWIFR